MDQERLKILLLDTGKEWGGGTNSMLALLAHLPRNVFDVHCCFYYNYVKDRGQTVEQTLTALGIPVVFIPQFVQPRKMKWLKELCRGLCFFSRKLRRRVTFSLDKKWRIEPNARKIRTLLIDGNFDILYMNNQPASNIEGYLAADGLSVRVVQHCRTEALMDAGIAKIVNARAGRIIAVSDGARQTLIEGGVNPDLCTTVFDGIDIHQPLPDGRSIRKALGVDDDMLLFGSIGTLRPLKSHHHTLAALRLFRQRFPAIRWKAVILGEGSERARLERLTEEYGLSSHVIFTGFQRNAMEYQAAFDIFISASRSEGFSLVILEAMLLRTPVLSSITRGSQNLVHSGQTGISFPYGDIDALACQLAALCQDAALRRRLAETAYRHVTAHFTMENYVQGVIRCLLQAMQPVQNAKPESDVTAMASSDKPVSGLDT